MYMSQDVPQKAKKIAAPSGESKELSWSIPSPQSVKACLVGIQTFAVVSQAGSQQFSSLSVSLSVSSHLVRSQALIQ
jgi:hypothetical protein